jgi:hypothetical protein
MAGQCIRIWCSGWYCWHWKGVVYPADLPTSRWSSWLQQPTLEFGVVRTEQASVFFHPGGGDVLGWNSGGQAYEVFSLSAWTR